MTRDEAISTRLSRWLRRFNPPKLMEDDEDLKRQEFNALFDAIDRYAPKTGSVAAFVDKALDEMEFQMTYRLWPTKGELAKVCEGLAPRVQAEAGADPARGDRSKLSGSDLATLDRDILPTARRWVRDMPGIAHHAQKTLEYWGETA